MSYKKKNIRQIDRKDGYQVFVEAVSAFNIGKVMLNFVKYDERQGNKQTVAIPIYIDVGDFFTFYDNLFVNGSLGKRLVAEKRKAAAGPQSYGAGEITLAIGGGNKTFGGQNVLVQRKLTLMLGDKKPFVLKAFSTPAVRNNQKLIVPIKNAPREQREMVTIALTQQDLMSMVNTIKIHINAYYSSFYMQNYQQMGGEIATSDNYFIPGENNSSPNKQPSNNYSGNSNNQTNSNYGTNPEVPSSQYGGPNNNEPRQDTGYQGNYANRAKGSSEINIDEIDQFNGFDFDVNI